MPQQDQDLNYKVKLDTADLAAQLQQVRAQIDQAVGSVAFNSTAMTSQPSQFAFPIQDYARQAGLLVQADMQNVVSAAQMGGRHIATMTEAAQLGFQKFNNDVQNALLTQGPALVNTAAGGFYPDPAQKGFTENAAASLLGLGYNPRYSITPGEYGRLARYQAADQMVGAGLKTAGSLSGGWFGGMVGSAVLPGIGTFVGEAVGSYLGEKVGGLADDTLGATILRDFTYGNKIKNYASETSWRFLGGRFTRAEAGQIGENLAGAQRSEALLGFDMRAGDVSRLMTEFTEIGGFDNVRSAQEYQTKAKTMIENSRKIMQILHTTETEALATVKEFNMLGPNIDVASMTRRTAAAAYASGLTGKEMLEFSNQTAQMVRGTGINMGSVFLSGMDVSSYVRGGRQIGAISDELVNQFGGEQNYSRNLMRVGWEWAQSTSGLTQFATASAMGGFGNTIGMSPTQTMGAAVGYLTKGGIQGMIEYSGTMQERIGNQSPIVLNAMSGMQTAEQMYAAGIKVNKDSFIGMMQLQGKSTVEAAQTWNAMVSGDTRNTSAMFTEAIKRANDATPGVMSIMKDEFLNNLSSSIQATGATRVLRGVGATVENWLDTDTARARRTGVHQYDLGGVDVTNVSKEKMEEITKTLDTAGKYTGKRMDEIYEGAREKGDPINQTDFFGFLRAKDDAIGLKRTDEERRVAWNKEKNKTYTLVEAYKPATSNAMLDAQRTVNKAFSGTQVNTGLGFSIDYNPVSWGAHLVSGIEGWIGRSQLKADQAYHTQLEASAQDQYKDLSELQKTSTRLKAMGASMERSQALQNDPMLAINQMSADSATRGAAASAEMVLMARTTGLNVNVNSKKGFYDYSKDEKK